VHAQRANVVFHHLSNAMPNYHEPGDRISGNSRLLHHRKVSAVNNQIRTRNIGCRRRSKEVDQFGRFFRFGHSSQRYTANSFEQAFGNIKELKESFVLIHKTRIRCYFEVTKAEKW
jgi:hypothetical protein